MSILQYHFRSRVLNMSTSITVTIPDQSDGKTPWDKTLDDIYYPGKKYPGGTLRKPEAGYDGRDGSGRELLL